MSLFENLAMDLNIIEITSVEEGKIDSKIYDVQSDDFLL